MVWDYVIKYIIWILHAVACYQNVDELIFKVSHCVYNTNSHLHTHLSEIWYKIKNEMLGRTVLTTWLMISLHWFRWLFGNSWDNGFLSEFVTCMLDATLSILPWLTPFKNTFSTYDTLINTHFVDKCNAFNVNRQKALKILIWHIS